MMTAFEGTTTAPSRTSSSSFDLGELSRQQHMVGIGHLGTYGESTRLRVYLRVGEIHQSFVGIDGVVRPT